jgi:glutamine amidotransferase
MKKNVVIVDYGLGNIFSINQVCQSVGLNSVVSSNKKVIRNADALILPGVGAFGEAMNSLQMNDLIEPIHDFVKTGKQFLGICLGMQLLFSQSEEFGINRGLDLIQGNIVKFPKTNNENNFLHVPQIQWNKIHKTREKEWNNSPLEGINDGEYMYFVHSFYAIPKDEKVILSYTEYGGIEYASSVIKDNIVGIQFHPEKSAKEGIKIYQNWASQISNKI